MFCAEKLVSREEFLALVEEEKGELQELLDMEPDCKWVVLTMARLVLLGEDKSAAKDLIEQLKTIDPNHATYYEYLQTTKL